MALAHLSRELERSEPDLWRFSAFVVDHGVREHSTVEAQSVVRRLQSMGLDSSLLTVQWSGDVRPGNSKHIETKLRSLRFRELGRACLQRGIGDLLLAHHEDDQAETVMMRILGGASGTGTHGIKPVAAIPECEGLWGIHQQAFGKSSESPAFAAAGVTLYRPLLAHDKASLVKTCQDAGVNWVEDPTNADLTLTQRNTVRYLLRSGHLPRAFRKASILGFGKSSQQSDAVIDKRAVDLIRSLQELSLDVRSGTLKLSGDLLDRPTELEDTIPKLRAARQLAELVSPASSVPVDRIMSVMDGEASATKIQTFSGALLNWQRIQEPDRPARWLISRQPYNSMDIRQSCCWAPSPQSTTSRFGSWQLYDGRFWLCVLEADGNESINARAFRESDLGKLRRMMLYNDFERLTWRLWTTARGKIRWTLPVLALGGSDIPVALPTLRMRVPLSMYKVDYRVKYKHIDSPPKNLRIYS
ncbi:MAG: hypothetical protein M1828_004631 [Chrysothrix sp. TS-e1954]|nr:MAG: hypothetical protein M1828_004631 [Chrysothrix sp. TS-e1954]